MSCLKLPPYVTFFPSFLSPHCPPLLQPNMTSIPQTIIGGDDVRAIIVDCGSWVTRVGSAGDDTPRSIVPSAIGIRPSLKRRSPSDDNAMTDADPPTPLPPRPCAGDILTNAPLAFTDVCPVFQFDGMGRGAVRDWDGMQKIWESACEGLRLKTDTSPLLIVEPAREWGDDGRASAMERAFEGLGVPAAYLARGSAMAAFASARTTACVVDVGHQGSLAVPVVDGYALHKSVVESTVGGMYLSERLRQWTEKELRGRQTYDGGVYRGKGDRLRAHHEVKRERLISDAAVRKFKITDLTDTVQMRALTEGHKRFYRLRVIDEVKAQTFRVSQGKTPATEDSSVAGKEPVKSQVNGGGSSVKGKKESGSEAKDGGSDEKEGSDGNGAAPKQNQGKDKSSGSILMAEYELPDGNTISVREDEGGLFADELFTTAGMDKVSLPELAFRSVSACDIDARRDLFGGVVLTGGTSLISGTVERFTRELAVKTPQMYKLKVLAATNAIERSCGPWIGGSIVASLGTFQQTWVSKAEYAELGSHGVLRKCP